MNPVPSPRRRAEPHPVGPPAADVQTRITEAAFELFADQGYEATTVEAIAQRAGVARRTFFRHFPSKDDVIFPDHGHLQALTLARLTASADASPLAAVCSAVWVVFDSYAAAPERSVARYRLSRSVPELRHREIASVEPYQRMFARYLTQRMDDPLTAELGAACVVAAHNHVLRDWLRSGGVEPAEAALEAALALVQQLFVPRGSTKRGAAAAKVVVAVIETTEPADAVASRLRDLLGAKPTRN